MQNNQPGVAFNESSEYSANAAIAIKFRARQKMHISRFTFRTARWQLHNLSNFVQKPIHQQRIIPGIIAGEFATDENKKNGWR